MGSRQINESPINENVDEDQKYFLENFSSDNVKDTNGSESVSAVDQEKRTVIETEKIEKDQNSVLIKTIEEDKYKFANANNVIGCEENIANVVDEVLVNNAQPMFTSPRNEKIADQELNVKSALIDENCELNSDCDSILTASHKTIAGKATPKPIQMEMEEEIKPDLMNMKTPVQDMEQLFDQNTDIVQSEEIDGDSPRERVSKTKEGPLEKKMKKQEKAPKIEKREKRKIKKRSPCMCCVNFYE